MNYTYSDDVAASDPTTGKLKFDSIDFTAITKFRISLTDADAVDRTTTIRGWDTGVDPDHRGSIIVQKVGSPGDFVLFEVTAARVDNSGWEEFTVAFTQQGGTIADGDSVQIFRAGASSISGSVTGRSAGLRFSYSSDTASSDPTAGKLKFDDPDPSLATVLRISNTDDDNNPLAALLALLDGSTSAIRSILVIYREGAPGTVLVLSVTAARTDNSGWKEFPVTVIASNGVFNDGDAARIVFALTGDKGDDGAPGAGAGGGAGGFIFNYNYDSSTTVVADPGDGTLRLNGTTSTATILVISDFNSGGRVLGDYYTHQASGNYIILRNPDLDAFAIFRVTGAPTHHATGDGWTEIPIASVDYDGGLIDGILNPGNLLSVECSGPYA
jgi:hypothetical protein